MSPLFNILIIIATVFGLWGGAVWVVESASIIAKKLGLSELVIGLTVVAIATSAPEFAVTVIAAIQGSMSISVGNVVGSNIFNLGVILGLVAMLGVVSTNRSILFRDGMLLLGTGVMLTLFFLDNHLSFIEGILLVITLIVYIIVLIRQKEKVEEDIATGNFKWFDIIKLIAGVGLILISADFLVDSATDIARHYGVSEWMIGITIVAAGTSVPELATSLVAVAKGRHGISIGLGTVVSESGERGNSPCLRRIVLCPGFRERRESANRRIARHGKGNSRGRKLPGLALSIRDR